MDEEEGSDYETIKVTLHPLSDNTDQCWQDIKSFLWKSRLKSFSGRGISSLGEEFLRQELFDGVGVPLVYPVFG